MLTPREPEEIVAELRQMDVLTTRRQSATGAVRAADLSGVWASASEFKRPPGHSGAIITAH
jgi:hypothetical protein